MEAHAGAGRERILVTVLLSISLLSIISVSTVIHPVRAAGVLYISPNVIGTQPAGTIITYQVKVANIDPFNAWDISVASDNNTINPQSVDITGNMLAVNYSLTLAELVHCVNGVGTNCQAADGPGIVHSAVAAFGAPPQSGPSSGLLFTITYRVISGGIASNVRLYLDNIVNGNTVTAVPHTDQNGRYGSKLPPVAEFTWSPSRPLAGDPVTFNASRSYDPNPGGSIVSYVWDFSNGLAPPPSKSPTIVHSFVDNDNSPLTGNFTVTLTIVDSLGIANSNTTIVIVRERKFHDLAVNGIQILNHDDDGILPGTVIHMDVTVLNKGTSDESGWNVTVRINGKILVAPYISTGSLTRNTPISVPFVWNTSGLKPDSYEILAVVSPAINETQYEPSLANNHLAHYVRIISPVGASFITLSLLTTIGLVPLALIIVAVPVGFIRRAQRSNKQLAEEKL